MTALGHDEGKATVIQADDRAVVVGTAGSDFAVARYNLDGSLDSGFGVGGKVTTDFGTGLDSANAAALQADGKIVVAGATGQTNTNFALARYNADGSLDTSFDGDGMLTTDLGATDNASAVAIQDDGKIVVAGAHLRIVNNKFDNDIALARYNADGSLDTGFSGDGKVTTDFGSGSSEYARAVALQGDGKIVIAGYSNLTGGGDFALARYSANGLLDATFSGDGRVTTGFSGGDIGQALGVRADGGIVAAGRSEFSGMAVASYATDGSLTATRTDTDFSGGDVTSGTGLALQDDGKLIVARGSVGGDFIVGRLNANLSFDSTFSGDGKATANLGGVDRSQAVGVDSAGRITAAGVSVAHTGGDGDFGVARFTGLGGVDSGFSGDGSAHTDFGGDDGAEAVAFQPDGKLLAAGYTKSDLALIRYAGNGSADLIRTHNYQGTDVARAVTLQGDGSVVTAGGRDIGGTSDFLISRFTAAHLFADLTFGGFGFVATDFGGADQAYGVTTQFGDRLLAGGESDGNFALARYTLGGVLDTAFDGDGKLTTDFGAADGARALLIQPSDDKILVAGFSGGDFALARYGSDGTLDGTFSGDGLVTTDLGGDDRAQAMALQGDGKIVLAGSSGGDFALARYDSDGTLDETFDGDGRLTTDFGAQDGAEGVVIQPDGKIVAAGSSGGDFALARYTTAGSPDTAFSGDGRQTTDFAGADGASGLLIQPDTDLVAAGFSDQSGTSDFALARYEEADLAAPETKIDSGPLGGSTITTGAPTFTFSANESGVSFECRFDAAAFAPCSGPDSAHTPDPPLADGPHVFEVRAIDGAGNIDSSPASRSFTVDTTAPTSTIISGPADGSATSNQSPTFTFVANEGGSTFECRLETVDFGPCSGSGSHSPAAPLPDGEYTFAVRSSDLFGNQEASPPTRTFTVDSADPETQIDDGPADGSTISDMSPTFTFSSDEAGVDFECNVDGDGFSPCSGPGGSHTAELGWEGPHSFEVRAVDAAGNIDESPVSRSFVVDASPPMVWVDPPSGTYTTDDQPTFTFNVSEAATVACSLVASGSPASFGSCSGSDTHTPPAALGDGSYEFAVIATDSAGNTGGESVTIVIDTTPPALEIDSGPAEGARINDATPTFEFSSNEPDAPLSCRFDSDEFQPCSGPGSSHTPTSPLAEGPHSFELKAVDPAGNDRTLTRSFSVDLTPPQTQIDSGPADGATIEDARPTFTFSSSEPGSSFECKIDVGAFGPCSGPGNGHTPSSALADGPHSFSVRASDDAGNVDDSPAVRSFTVGTAPPPDDPAPTEPRPSDDPPVDETPPETELTAKKAQSASKPLVVELTCDEDCSAKATGVVKVTGKALKRPASPARKPMKLKLRTARAELDAGESAKLRLRLSKKNAKKLKRALKRGAKAAASLRIEVVDAAGNATVDRQRLKLKR